MGRAFPPRMLVAEVPDWPVTAAGQSPEVAVVVVAANWVVAASEAARREGVRDGLRRREAQGRCPELLVIPADEGRDARAWEAGVAAVETFAPGVEVLSPGRVALATRGPSRYFGGDRALGERVAAAVDAAVGGPGCRVGIADGCFAASLAARTRRAPKALDPGTGHPVVGDRVVVVAPGASRKFIAPRPVSVLGRPDLADLLVRLGLPTLGDLGALAPSAVLARFGPDGAVAARLARGLDARPLAVRTPPPDLTRTAALDPPAQQVEATTFVGKALADRLLADLAERGLACTRVMIRAETAHGEVIERCWRHEGALNASAIAERVRWQLDGWLASGRTTAGITSLGLTPEEICPDHGRQLDLWGGSAAADERVARSLARIQGLLGHQAVVTAVLSGGRDPATRVRLVPWGDPRDPSTGQQGAAPWPGQLPGLAPALVHRVPRPAQVRDVQGKPLAISGRGLPSGVPAGLLVADGEWAEISAWAGPWPVEERWWEDGGRRRARFQVGLVSGEVHLLVREGGHWWLEATYD
jgi:protein ImuB